MNNCCVVCGMQVPEGLQVCPACARDADEFTQRFKEEEV